jgi:hypothetical protein
MTDNAQERTYNYYNYVSDDGNTYAVRADAAWGTTDSATSGGAAATAGNGYGKDSRRRHKRYGIFTSPAYRSFKGVFFTAAAFAAATLNTTTVTRYVPGLEDTVTFTLRTKVAEKLSRGSLARTSLGQDAAAA